MFKRVMGRFAQGSPDGPKKIFGRENINWVGPQRAAEADAVQREDFYNIAQDFTAVTNAAATAYAAGDMESYHHLVNDAAKVYASHRHWSLFSENRPVQEQMFNKWKNDYVEFRRAAGLTSEHDHQPLTERYQRILFEDDDYEAALEGVRDAIHQYKEMNYAREAYRSRVSNSSGEPFVAHPPRNDNQKSLESSTFVMYDEDGNEIHEAEIVEEKMSPEESQYFEDKMGDRLTEMQEEMRRDFRARNGGGSSHDADVFTEQPMSVYVDRMEQRLQENREQMIRDHRERMSQESETSEFPPVDARGGGSGGKPPRNTGGSAPRSGGEPPRRGNTPRGSSSGSGGSPRRGKNRTMFQHISDNAERAMGVSGLGVTRLTGRKRLGPFIFNMGMGGIMGINSISIKAGPVMWSIWSKDYKAGFSSLDLPGPLSFRGKRTRKTPR